VSFATDNATRHAGHKHLMPHWLVHLGVLGVFAVSALDSSIIPLPIPGSTDLLILLLAANHGNPWLLAAAGIGGSLLGGYLTWSAGKRGGQPMLEKYVPQRYLGRIVKWVKSWGASSVAVATVLPPPIPLTPFLLAAGALGVSRIQFLLALFAGRLLRYGLMAWLGATYGHQMIRLWSRYLAGWSDVILWTFLGLLVAAILFGFWKYKRDKSRHGSEAHAAVG
jgi:membrane protein YqaA with SNARE-associated domain